MAAHSGSREEARDWGERGGGRAECPSDTIGQSLDFMISKLEGF